MEPKLIVEKSKKNLKHFLEYKQTVGYSNQKEIKTL